jgi:hypothetical protein
MNELVTLLYSIRDLCITASGAVEQEELSELFWSASEKILDAAKAVEVSV